MEYDHDRTITLPFKTNLKKENLQQKGPIVSLALKDQTISLSRVKGKTKIFRKDRTKQNRQKMKTFIKTWI